VEADHRDQGVLRTTGTADPDLRLLSDKELEQAVAEGEKKAAPARA